MLYQPDMSACGNWLKRKMILLNLNKILDQHVLPCAIAMLNVWDSSTIPQRKIVISQN